MSEQPDDVAEQTGTDTGVDVTDDSTTQQESYHGYSVDDEDQPQGDGDSLVDDRGLPEPLDEGYSPPEKWSAAQGYGNTPLEEELGETLDQRVAQEIPEPDPYLAAAQEDADPDIEVGDERAGRLVAEDEGVATDTEKDLVARDVGIDGAGASAEEAAVHLIDDGTEDVAP
ncbi:MAG: hypothetical protein JWO76_244 [Nocardioides sp.]|nr:hypothetical protein [Nocardioides sp.]